MQGVIAFGMTMVIISGEIDLSVGSAVAFAGCLTAFVTQFLAGTIGMPLSLAVPSAIAVTFAAGFGVGSLTGYLRVRFGVPTFIITLAWMTVLTGAAELITDGFPLTPFPQWYNFLGGGYLFGVPFPAIVFILVFMIIHFVMNFTSFGRSVYAVGGNAEAARLSGINVRKAGCSRRCYAVGADNVRHGHYRQGMGVGYYLSSNYRRHLPDRRHRNSQGDTYRYYISRRARQRHDPSKYQRILAARRQRCVDPRSRLNQPCSIAEKVNVSIAATMLQTNAVTKENNDRRRTDTNNCLKRLSKKPANRTICRLRRYKRGRRGSTSDGSRK
jgi:hypothetical protein